MYERFTDRASKVLQYANMEAKRFNQEYIGTEHILLGLLKEGSGTGANVLKNLDIDLRKVRLEVEKIVMPGPDMVTMGTLPHTPRAKKVIEYAIEEARIHNHNYVGTEHLLLGLLREQEGVAAQVLMNLGLPLDETRQEVLNLLGHNMTTERPSPFLKIDGSQEYAFGLGTRLTVWTLSGAAVKELSARLLACTDGKACSHADIRSHWDDLSKPVSGQLVLLMQDGLAFEVTGKRLFSLGIAFSSGGPSSTADMSSTAVFANDLPNRSHHTARAGGLPGKQLIYAEFATPAGEEFPELSFGADAEAIAAASKGGRLVLAVVLEWKP